MILCLSKYSNKIDYWLLLWELIYEECPSYDMFKSVLSNWLLKN